MRSPVGTSAENICHPCRRRGYTTSWVIHLGCGSLSFGGMAWFSTKSWLVQATIRTTTDTSLSTASWRRTQHPPDVRPVLGLHQQREIPDHVERELAEVEARRKPDVEKGQHDHRDAPGPLPTERRQNEYRSGELHAEGRVRQEPREL